ncbi:MAG: ABC transporter permease [Clostridia bacterium]|nr:ABC transporter permease [Clostridia bacterium]
MTVFNAFLKVIRKNIGTIIIYTLILIIFSAATMQSPDSSGQYTSEKQDILIINNDKGSALSDHLEEYLKANTNAVEITGGEDAIKDALFYREIVYIVNIPKGYGSSVMAGRTPSIEVQTTESYGSALVDMMLTRYLKLQNVYLQSGADEHTMIHSIDSALDDKTNVEMISQLDTDSLSQATRFFDFSAYNVTACIVFIICLVLSSFNDIDVRKRTLISSTDIKKYHLYLLTACCSYALAVWAFFSVLSYIMVGDVILTPRGGIYILNSLVFSLTVLSMAYFLSTIIHTKTAVTGIVNVVALGSAFLCGAFVPAEFLPEWVLKAAHILPAYWFINSNDLLGSMETLSVETLKPILVNMAALLLFLLLFVTASIIISRKKQKIA